MTKTLGTYFTGGDLFGAGAEDAGLTSVFGVEYDSHPKRIKTSMRIADMFEVNFPDSLMIRQPVQEIDPNDLPSVFWFHSSPVCKNFSNAKKDGIADDVDIVTAQATCDYITHHLPKVVTIENVRGYAGSDALVLILKRLSKNGYSFREDIINMANYGVPQTRIRLIVTAVLDSPVPSLTPPTHEKNPGGMFALKKWVSWYEAIEDILHTLPDSQFAPWQLARLPEELKDSFFINPNRSSLDRKQETDLLSGNVPSSSIMAGNGESKYRAFLIGQGNYSSPKTNEPYDTVTSNSNQSGIKAFIVNESSTMEITGKNAPVSTQVSSNRNGNQKAFVVIPDNTSSDRRTIAQDEPINTQTIWSSKHPPPMGYANGRIVKMTSQAIARFMSLPDWYQLSGHNTTDYTALGNGVPSLFVQKHVEHVLTKIPRAAA